MLVGRDEDIGLIEQLVDKLRTGAGASLLLLGEPGAGKTMLLRHAQSRADGLTVLMSQGLDGETSVPYAGLHRLLQPVAGLIDRLLEPADAEPLTDAMRLSTGAPTDAIAVATATLRFLH